MKKEARVLGLSTQGRSIELYRYGLGKIPILWMAGVHGDEIEGVELLQRFLLELDEDRFALPPSLSLYAIPVVNPDGVFLRQRQNANAVDLNRNMPTKDWSAEAKTPRYTPGPTPGSEVENQYLVKLLEEISFRFILSFHSYSKTLLNINGDCLSEARVMQEFNHLRISDDMGYPTPGSFGTYAGLERNIPTITFELLEETPLETLWAKHQLSLSNLLHFLHRKHGETND